MIKKILLSFIAIFTVVSGIIIFYWRDVQYNPNKIDFFLYFLLLPAIITLVILSPWLIYSVYKSYLCTRQISQNPYPIRVLPS
ncbi:hypothetical protein BFX39_16505 [Acinetobacter baumannii]|nr:hypothetical protein BFX36_15290 [Acinetobacter baumannii]OSY68536.1 hypothetical protein BFX37_15930 [Acinetobacter baumannii]OSY70051.1 hypothetical protein BFX39_16505 [Acinetobacter baumannii]